MTSQSESELNEASESNNNYENRFLEDKASQRKENDDTITIQLQSFSNISWELLANSFNLTSEDLELR